MCGRFTLASDVEDFEAVLADLEIEYAPGPRYNIAPTQPVSTILNDGRTKVVDSRWGLVPSWAKDPGIAARLINARAESLAEKPSFKTPLKQRRCLVLADGFYEWTSVPGQTRKVPHYFRLRNHKPFAFAGLWDTWKPPDGEPLRTCTIITTEPNELVRDVHDRMPVILPPATYTAWLRPGDVPPHESTPLLAPYPADEMESFPVSTHVNRVANDNETCIQPAGENLLF